MTFSNPKSGLNLVAEYQSSALPFVTSSTAPASGSPVRISFPKISRSVTISNRDSAVSASLSFGFTRAGVVSTNNKYILNGGQSVTLELRVKEIWLQGEVTTPAYSLCAGLTNIDASLMPVLTGTLPDATAGWQGVG